MTRSSTAVLKATFVAPTNALNPQEFQEALDRGAERAIDMNERAARDWDEQAERNRTMTMVSLIVTVITVGSFPFLARAKARKVRRDVFIAAGRCGCGYSLEGLTGHICPECGENITNLKFPPKT